MEPYHYTNYYTTSYFRFFPPLMTRIRGKSQTPQKMHRGEEIERKKERKKETSQNVQMMRPEINIRLLELLFWQSV